MISFHTPGHKGRADLFQGLCFPADDLTELPGLDMLHYPKGILKEAQSKAAALYGAEESFFLVNGGTCGNQAMLMAIGARFPAGKVLIQRQSHRSVVAGLVLSGLTPVYLPAVIHPEFQLPLGTETEKAAALSSDLQALHFTYPGYYGTLPDLESCLAWRKAQAPQVPVLVDSAHGAHYLNDLFPPDALGLGADAVLHSSHKTLNVLTQGALLHAQGSRIDRFLLKQALEMLQTSSPNYLLMASLARAVEMGRQRAHWQELREAVQELQEGLKGKIRFLDAKDAGSYGIHRVDWSKILVNVRSVGWTGPEAADYLRKEYRLEPELWDDNNILFLLGIGNNREDIRYLAEGLEGLALADPNGGIKSPEENKNREFSIPPLRLTPRQAWQAPKKKVRLTEALGKICGETISIYPPGIPLVTAGEEVTTEAMAVMQEQGRYQWQGWENNRTGELWVVDL